MNDEPILTEADESPVRDEALERAFQFFLRCKGWTPSKLAKVSGVPLGVVHQAAVLGYAPSVATLRRLCNSLGVDLWVLFLMGELLSHDDPEASVESIVNRLKAALPEEPAP